MLEIFKKCRFSYGLFFSDRSIISRPLDLSLHPEERHMKLDSRKSLLEKVKKYIDEKLNLAKANVMDPEKENYKTLLTIDETLLKLDISKEDYYHSLSISVDDDYEPHLIRPPNSCFVNNYFDASLRAWQANMNIQPVFNEYKAVAYMCSFFSKSEDKCSFAMKQAAREARKLDQFNTMKNILKAYTSNRECSVQEAVYHIFPELHLRRVFPGVQFVNTALPEGRSKILQTEGQLSSLPEDSNDFFKRNNIDRYLPRSTVSFCDGKHGILDSFCFAQFTAYYSLMYKPKETNEGEEYQPDLYLTV